ncbi:hypothetical protein ACH5RR_034071 [Cinchona calisaya]|uniref:Uncharacterized protein n=1 Tax=Cinchona calisaya TaxID=153742 RepID=A0ABD2YAN3_9GENT
MRYKSWSYYEDWIEIYGKDRVIGEHPEELYCLQPLQVPISMSMIRKRKKGKKRKLGSDYENSGLIAVANALGNFTKKIEARLEMVDERIGYEHDIRESRQKVYASLNPMTSLSV